MAVWDQQISNYRVRSDSTLRSIYPKNRHGDTIRVMLEKHAVTLRHVADGDNVASDVIFSRYKHQGRWFWRDSRQPVSCNRQHVVTELGRMLKLPAPSEFVRENLHG